MEDLKSMMENGLPIADIHQRIHQYIHSLEGYENRLKTVFVLFYLITESAKIIKTVNSDGFISDILARIMKLDQDAKNLNVEYRAQLIQNDEVLQILTDSSDNRVEDIKKEISTLLNEYDSIIKNMVDIREKMSIEEQIAVEKANGTNT